MSEASVVLLQRFFAAKAQSGEPISAEETQWIETIMAASSQQPQQQQDQRESREWEGSQSVVGGRTDYEEDNVFLLPQRRPSNLSISDNLTTLTATQQSVSDYITRPLTSSGTEALRKYHEYYSQSQESPRKARRTIHAPPPKLASLDSRGVLGPVLEMVNTASQASSLPEESSMENIIEEKEVGQDNVVVTSTASMILGLLGPSKKSGEDDSKKSEPKDSNFEIVIPVAREEEAFEPVPFTDYLADLSQEKIEPSTKNLLEDETVNKAATFAPATPAPYSQPSTQWNFTLTQSTPATHFTTSQSSIATPLPAPVADLPLTPTYELPVYELPTYDFESTVRSSSDLASSLLDAALNTSDSQLPTFSF